MCVGGGGMGGVECVFSRPDAVNQEEQLFLLLALEAGLPHFDLTGVPSQSGSSQV